MAAPEEQRPPLTEAESEALRSRVEVLLTERRAEFASARSVHEQLLTEEQFSSLTTLGRVKRLWTAKLAAEKPPVAAREASARAAPRSGSRLGAVIVPALVEGGHLYIQHAWWWGCEPSAGAVEGFRLRHARAAARSGLSPAQVAAEQTLFSAPLWGLTAGGEQSLSPDSLLLINAVRFGVTSLGREEVLACIAAATRLAEAWTAEGERGAGLSTCRAVFEQLPRPSAEQGGLLQFILNVPYRVNAWVFSLSSKEVIPVKTWLDLDTEVYQKALRTVLKPTETQKATSRNVCVWCGAPPVASGVVLRECAGCARLAYCSSECADCDWQAVHNRECGKPWASVEMSITRTLTELTARPASSFVMVFRTPGRLVVEAMAIAPPAARVGAAFVTDSETAMVPYAYRVSLAGEYC